MAHLSVHLVPGVPVYSSGGNRCSKGRWVLNLFLVWAATGIWHGASWNFVLWGLYFWVLLLVEKFVLLRWLKRAPVR